MYVYMYMYSQGLIDSWYMYSISYVHVPCTVSILVVGSTAVHCSGCQDGLRVAVTCKHWYIHDQRSFCFDCEMCTPLVRTCTPASCKCLLASVTLIRDVLRWESFKLTRKVCTCVWFMCCCSFNFQCMCM